MCDPSRQENRPQNERDPNREREQKAREIIGGVTATLIWFFVDLTFVWPESHQWAYWFAVIFVGAQVIQIGRLRLRTMAIALGIWIVVAAIGYPFLPPTPRPETETHFWIQPGSQPMPSGLCNGQLTDKNLVVRFGSFAVTTTLNYYRALLIMGCTQVVLERTDRGLAVSTDIYDEGGNEIVEIDSNEVKRLPQNIIDRTPNGFLVKGPGWKPLFRVAFVNPQLIDIAATYHCQSGDYIVGDSEGGITGPGIPSGEFSNMCINGGSAGPIIVQPRRGQ